jgi:hypothetical protein
MSSRSPLVNYNGHLLLDGIHSFDPNSLRFQHNRLAGVVMQHSMEESRLKQQIATLEEEFARLKQENMDQKGELQKLNQKLQLQEPLLKVGVNIRRRFLEKAKMKRGFGNPVESIVEAGNTAAHRGNIFADSALFALGVLRSTDSVSRAGGSTEIEDNYRSLGRDLYGVDVMLSSSNSTKKAEIFNLSATITSCSTMKPGEYNTTDVRHRRFHELAARCAKLERAIEEGSCGQFESRQKYLDAFDSCPEIDEYLQEMRDIAEHVVGLSMGHNRYRMGG